MKSTTNKTNIKYAIFKIDEDKNLKRLYDEYCAEPDMFKRGKKSHKVHNYVLKLTRWKYGHYLANSKAITGAIYRNKKGELIYLAHKIKLGRKMTEAELGSGNPELPLRNITITKEQLDKYSNLSYIDSIKTYLRDTYKHYISKNPDDLQVMWCKDHAWVIKVKWGRKIYPDEIKIVS